MGTACSVKTGQLKRKAAAKSITVQNAEKEAAKAVAAAQKALRLSKTASLKASNLSEVGTKYKYGPVETRNMSNADFHKYLGFGDAPVAQKKLLNVLRRLPPEEAARRINFLKTLTKADSKQIIATLKQNVQVAVARVKVAAKLPVTSADDLALVKKLFGDDYLLLKAEEIEEVIEQARVIKKFGGLILADKAQLQLNGFISEIKVRIATIKKNIAKTKVTVIPGEGTIEQVKKIFGDDFSLLGSQDVNDVRAALKAVSSFPVGSPQHDVLATKLNQLAARLRDKIYKFQDGLQTGVKVSPGFKKAKYLGGPPSTRNMSHQDFMKHMLTVNSNFTKKQLKLLRLLRQVEPEHAKNLVEGLKFLDQKLKLAKFQGTKLNSGFKPQKISKGSSPTAANVSSLNGIDDVKFTKTVKLKLSSHGVIKGTLRVGEFDKDEMKAMATYKSNGYRGILKLQRERAGGPANTVHPTQITELLSAERRLQSAMLKSVVEEELVVYRGLNGPFATEVFKGLNVGDRLPAVSFSSASVSKNVAQGFGSHAMMEITVPTGSNAIHLDQALRLNKFGVHHPNSNENELLLPSEGAFEIIEKTTRSIGAYANRTYVRVRFIGRTSKAFVFNDSDYVLPEFFTVDADGIARSLITDQELYLMLVAAGKSELAAKFLALAA